jgi:hypothetical protein
MKPEAQWRNISDIPDFPFKTFSELKGALESGKFSLGVDPLAAAEWAESHGSRMCRSVTAALSLLLLAAAIASVVAALWIRNYWLLAATPIMAAAFYLSDPSLWIHNWVTLAGAALVPTFLVLFSNGLVTAAALTAYAALTFAAVRAAAFISSASFRRALASDEALFLEAYAKKACALRNNETKQTHFID